MHSWNLALVLCVLCVLPGSVTAMRLLLVRHAQSQNNVIAAQTAIKYAGRPNSEMRAEFERLRSHEPALSATGTAQAELLSDYLAKEGLPHGAPCYCSPMQRTMLTMQPTLTKLGWAGNVRGELFEVGGSFSTNSEGVDQVHPGKTPNELQLAFPDYKMSDELLALGDQGWFRNPTRETHPQAEERAAGIVEWFWAQAAERGASGAPVDLVCCLHGDLLNMLLRNLLLVDPASKSTFMHYNTGCTLLNLNAERRQAALLYHNRVSHLDGHPDKVTGDEMLRVIA